jgi:tRNA-splicing ligase RtcB
LFEIKGSKNTAKVMLQHEGLLDPETRRQIETFVNHTAFEGPNIAIMPDTHAGMGAVIGFTMRMNDVIIPNVVGVDIGCGVDTYTLGGINDFNPAKLDKFIRENIPSGFSKRRRDPLSETSASLYATKADAKLADEEVAGIVRETGQDIENVRYSIGTLGGGNHFIEAGADSAGRLRLTIHSGSRNFGLRIANFHQRRAKDLWGKKAEAKGLEYLPIKKQGAEYLHDMSVAQRYADLNRRVMAMIIIKEFFGMEFDKIERITSVHNYIDFDDKIIRKGAIRAYQGERLVIPFNMEDGIMIGTGKSNREWNCSAPHGAGRVLSRRRAKEMLDLAGARESMREKGIFTTSLNKETLDEVRQAYKDKELILRSIEPTIEVVDFIKPVYNFKAAE